MHTYLLKELSVPYTSAQGAAVNNTKKKVVFKIFSLFISCITEINKTQVDNTENIDIVFICII